jgi:hypothetical protein
MIKRLKNDKRFRYKCLIVIFLVLTPPTVTIWRDSIAWLNFMSITALTLGAVASLEGATPSE